MIATSRWYLGIAVVMIGLCAVARADEPSTQQRVALSAKPSVVRIISAYTATFELNGRRGTISIGMTGTGWFITPDGHIATNAHVVADVWEGDDKARRKLELKLLKSLDKETGGKLSRMSQSELRQVTDRIKQIDQKRLAYIVLPNGDKLDYEIQQYGKSHSASDCAIIKVKIENAPTLKIGDSRTSQVADRIVVIGYPGVADHEDLLDMKSQLQPTVTDGVISALKRATSGEQIIQISAPITHGNSGGPAIDQHGNVVGLATFGSDVQGFNFIVASTTLMELAKAGNIQPRASDTNTAWNAGLDHYWAQEYSAAVKEFEEVQLLFPQHSEASNMIMSSNRAKKDGKEKQAASTEGVAGFAVLGVLGLVVAAIVIAVRRRRSSPRHPVQPAVPNGPPAMPPAMPWSPPQAVYGRAPQLGPSPPIARTIAVTPPARPAGGLAPTAFGSFSIGSITCMRGQLQGQRFALTSTGIVIGRQPDASHVLVNDHRASGKHVWIGIDQGRLVAIDQGTTNGTYINDITRGRITRAELSDGDVVIVGEPDCCTLQVRLS